MSESLHSLRHYQKGHIEETSVRPPDSIADAVAQRPSDWLILPGITDLAVHSLDLEAELDAARSTGVTRFCLQPDSLGQIADRATLVVESEQAVPEVLPLGAASRGLEGQQLSELASLKAAGCIAASDAGRLWSDSCTLKRTLEYARSTGLGLHLHPSNAVLSGGGCAHAGTLATRLGLNGIPVAAETSALCTLLELIEDTGSRLHIARISSARGVELIADAKRRGLPVTADVAIHNLVFNEHAIDGFNSLCHLAPPLRSERDRQALLRGIDEGIIDAIVSDHRPCSVDDKLAPFPATAPGAMALGALLPLTLKLIEAKELSLEPALYALCEGPAGIIGREPLGRVWVSTGERFTLDGDRSLGSGQNDPYRGWSLPGKQIIIES
ncbi:MAG: dihydroorotase [Pseudomonadota bacterium]